MQTGSSSSRPNATRIPWLLLALAAGAAAARWLTRTPVVYNWDSVHYVLAQDRYDLLAHQPHPPGSWYYVLLARALRPLAGDPHAALLLLSALSGGVLVIALFLLARELAGEGAGWIAAAVGASAPLFWFYGSVALNYAPAGALSALFALGCVRLCRGTRPLRSALLAGVSLGLLGGFRPTDAAFLAPAYFWALARGSALAGWKAGRLEGLGLGVFALLTVGWLLPNVVNAGGWMGTSGASGTRSSFWRGRACCWPAGRR